MEELLNLINNIKFNNRPIAVPSTYRIIYKVTQILLILKLNCKKTKGCSLQKLQIISNAISYEEYFENLKLFIDSRIQNIIIRYDPSLNRALKYALEENLICFQKNKLLKLTDKGILYVEQIISDKNLYIEEKNILYTISTKLTEDKIERLIIDWRLNNV